MDDSSYTKELLKKELDEAATKANHFANEEQAKFEPLNQQNFSTFDEKTNNPFEVDKMSS